MEMRTKGAFLVLVLLSIVALAVSEVNEFDSDPILEDPEDSAPLNPPIPVEETDEIPETWLECTVQLDCPETHTCENGTCIDVCSVSPCGINALCQVSSQGLPVCVCPEEYNGDPYTACVNEDEEEEGDQDQEEEGEEVDEFDLEPILGEAEDPTPTNPPIPVEKCNTVLSGESGLFASKNFPEKYPENTNCTWNISVPEGERAQITFHLFNIEPNQNCIWDYIKVFDTNGTLLKFVCGYLQQDLVVTASGNQIGVHFYSDGVIQHAGFLASWKAVPDIEDEESEMTSTIKEDKSGYLLSFPQTFTTSVEALEENVCLQMFQVPNDGEISVQIFDSKNLLNGSATVEATFSHTGGNKEIQCQSMRLPDDFYGGSGIVKIEGSFLNSDYKILSYKSVRALKVKPLTLLQTDKGDYRPNQVIKFRIMLLSYELKPSVATEVHEMWITNPQNDRLAQWKKLDLKKGIAQREFALPEEPMLGTWTVHAKLSENTTDEHKVTFVVAENVLPKFSVDITGPDVIYLDDENASFQICGIYNHGGKVKGNANVTFYTEYKENYWRAVPKNVSISKPVNRLEDGCTKISLNNTEIRTIAAKGPIKVEAAVEEVVTETKFSTGSSPFTVYNTPYKIDFSSSSNEHITGSFPYLGKIKVVKQDGTSVAGVRLQVCARLFTSLQNIRSYVTQNSHKLYSLDEDGFLQLADKLRTLKFAETCKEEITQSDGTISFAVPLLNVPANVTKLSFKASSVDYLGNKTSGMIRPNAKLDVSLSHSNSTSALAIVTEEIPEMTCGQNKIKVFFAGKANEEQEISHYVSSGGALLDSGVQRMSVGTEDVTEEYIGDATMLNILKDVEAAETVLSSYEVEVLRPFAEEGKVAEKIKLLLFIRKEDGSTLSTIREFNAESCSSQPAISFSQQKVNPGDKVQLDISGQSQALCAYSVVDKSVDLVPNSNRITVPRIQKLKEVLTSLRIVGDNNVKENCRNANLLFQSFERLGLFIMSDSILIDTRCDNLIDATSQVAKANDVAYYESDTFSAFDEDNDGVPIAQPILADVADSAPVLQQAFAPAPVASFSAQSASADGPPLARPGAGNFKRKKVTPSNRVASSTATIQAPKLEIRDYFPETWLFDMIDLDENGKATLDLESPHTITTWIADVYCSDEEHGLEISNKSNLVVNQDFFVDLSMPYSVKRGEILPINVSVFSNVDRQLPIKLSILESAKFKLDQFHKDLCLSANDNNIEVFNIKAQELNEVNVSIAATITDDIDKDCELAGQGDGFKDALVKPIQVKPEGFPVEKVESIFQCRSSMNDSEPVKLKKLELPKNLVEGSERAFIQVSGDIMAPALSNLDRLVTMPVGCGEQNMITMAPNVYLMDYLTGTGKKAPELEKTAKKYMKIGFDREQKFRHPNGAYSVWGPDDKVGSLWLTSFVVKVFSQASRFIDIDSRNVQESVDFITSTQLKNGCFRNVGYVIHSEFAGSDQSITASILITLLEVKQSKLDILLKPDIIDQAVKCLESNVTAGIDDLYIKSLTSYAFTLYNDLYEAKDPTIEEASTGLLNELLEEANTTTPGQIYWWDKSNSLSRSVEVTAYNVLSMVRQHKLPEALNAITWLATKRNGRGGFVSTQDTMVALQAVSQYSLKVSKSDNDLDVVVTEVDNDNFKHEFDLVEENELLLQKEKVQSLPTELSVDIQGEGCFMIQTILRYNVKDSPDQNSFTLTATQEGEEELKICSAFTGNKEKTDMVVIEIELLSGFAAYRDSLESLKNELEAPVKKYEYDEEKGEIVLYFDEMPKETTCWNIEVKRETVVDKLQPAIVKVYDYYNQEDVFSTEYNLQ